MEDEVKVLKVRMFGPLDLSLNGRHLKLEASTTKLMQVLAMLLYYREGIPRDTILNNLYGNAELADAKNNLRVTISRLRKAIKTTGISDGDSIALKKGIFYWVADAVVSCDVWDFEELLEKAERAREEGDEFTEDRLRQEAVMAYTGEFLSPLATEDWVAIESTALKQKFSDNLMVLCDHLKKKHEYSTILQVCDGAIRFYPYDDWQMIKIDALLAMNRYDEALALYNETAAQLFEELGLPPTESMLERFRRMSGEIEYASGTTGDIMDGLSEDLISSGAFYVAYPSFVDNYRMLQRITERSGESNYLLVINIVDRAGRPINPATETQTDYTESIKKVLQKSLRRTDTFTKYSASQYLVLLVALDQEAISVVTGRIDRALYAEMGGRRITCRYNPIPVARIEDGDNTGWVF